MFDSTYHGQNQPYAQTCFLRFVRQQTTTIPATYAPAKSIEIFGQLSENRLPQNPPPFSDTPIDRLFLVYPPIPPLYKYVFQKKTSETQFLMVHVTPIIHYFHIFPCC